MNATGERSRIRIRHIRSQVDENFSTCNLNGAGGVPKAGFRPFSVRNGVKNGGRNGGRKRRPGTVAETVAGNGGGIELHFSEIVIIFV